MTRKELLDKIKIADKAYYKDDSPIMTDKEYDRLRQLYIIKYGKKDLDYVPGEISSEFKKYRHPVPLLSLGKIHDDDSEAEKKLQRFVDKVGIKNIVVEPKIDGITVAAVPTEDNDGSCFFVTRGRGGIEGEILPRFKAAYSDVPGVNTTGSTVRGEAFITDSDFNEILKIQEKIKEKPFANSRNAVAGILRNINDSPYLQYVSYIAYEIPGSNESVYTQTKRIELHTKFMTIPVFGYNNVKYGFSTVKALKDSLQKFYDDWINDGVVINGIKSSGIPIDGLVLKYNIADSYEKFGVTGHHPNNAIAWKKTADEYETQVLDITWQVGRDSVTPVAELEPVEIDGTTVSRATLHNLGFFNRMALSKNDTVVICKSGEIIPKILRVSQHSDGDKFTVPNKCPSCDSILVTESRIEKDGREVAELCCENLECSQRVAQNIAFLASKDVLDIRGLSESTALKIVEANSPCDETIIFSLSETDIESLPKFGKISAENLYTEIKRAQDKKISLSLLIKAACISGIGNTVGTILENQFKTLMNVLALTRESLTDVPGIGPKTIDVLVSKNFKSKLKKISECLTWQEVSEEKPKENLAASDTVWVITGKFIINDRHVTRDEIVSMIESIGGTVGNSITKDTDYLLVAHEDTVSSKAQKAKKYGTKIVTFGFLQGLILA